MNTKVLLAALAGGVVSFLVGWVVFGMLLDPYYKSMMTAEGTAAMKRPEDMVMWAMIASNLVYGFLLAWIYSRYANISTFQDGAMAGAIITLLIALSFDLSMFSMFNLWTGSMGLIVDPLVNGVVGGIVGGVVGWVLGYGNKR